MTAARAILLPNKGAAWAEFAGASNLIGWRYRATHEHIRAYLTSWDHLGADVSFEVLYSRERHLFGMFTSGCSCIESTCYAIYALSSHPDVIGLAFGDREQRACSPKVLRDAVASEPRAQPLVVVLTDLLRSNVWHSWVHLRNRMLHRSNLPHIIRGAVGGPAPRAFALELAPTSSTPALKANESEFENLFDSLGTSLSALLGAGYKLASPSLAMEEGDR